MKYEPPKFKNLSDMAFIDVSRLTEDEARKMLEKLVGLMELNALLWKQ